MSPKKISNIADQGTFFEATPFGGTLLPIDPMSFELKADLADGPSVSLLERIGGLKDTLDELGKISMLGGFEHAATSEYSPQLRRPLERRYDSVDSVVGRSQDARARHELRAKQAFARAHGLKQMIEANPQSEDEYKAKVHGDYVDFIAKFADAKGAKNRADLKKQLRKQENQIIKHRKNSVK